MARHTLTDKDGNVIAAWCGDPLDDEGQAAMVALVDAVRRHHEQQDPDGTLGARQEAAIARIRERVRSLRG